MRSMKQKQLIPILLGVALVAFLSGMILSSSLDITQNIKATENEGVTNTESNSIGGSQLFVRLAAKLKPVAVNISTTKLVKRRRMQFKSPYGGDDFFERFFGGDRPQRDYTLRSLGSGFIIDKEGYIITNNHVIEGADEIKVRLSDLEHARNSL